MFVNRDCKQEGGLCLTFFNLLKNVEKHQVGIRLKEERPQGIYASYVNPSFGLNPQNEHLGGSLKLFANILIKDLVAG
jgi:hypothetical protein